MSSLPIRTKDNSERPLQDVEPCHLETLKKLAEPTIASLSLEEHPNLLIFPQDLNVYGDQIGDSHIFELKGERMVTGNIMGFIGCGNTKVSISSRFAQGENDYFLHYMLRKVFAVNLFDLQFNSDEESIFDFLIYLFPTFLKRAMQPGLYREYQTRRYNDANVKGRIDISRHIRQNIPFAGKIAYTTSARKWCLTRNINGMPTGTRFRRKTSTKSSRICIFLTGNKAALSFPLTGLQRELP